MPRRKPKVLICDDSPINVEILAACLEDEYELVKAHNGDECLKHLDAKKSCLPDLILLDVEMPGMDGYEVCKQIKSNEQTESIPVIFVTARQAEQDEEAAFNAGAVDYIPKPIRPTIVTHRVNTHVTLKRQRDLLKDMAVHDQLTGLYNRYILLDLGKKKFSESIRHDRPMSLLILDIDKFKLVNDNHGHLTGDAVLRAVAKFLNKAIREEDLVARYGGEEFVVLLDRCTISDALDKAEALRAGVEALKPNGLTVTISIGAAECASEETSFSDLLERADTYLYKAKTTGRNKVVFE